MKFKIQNESWRKRKSGATLQQRKINIKKILFIGHSYVKGLEYLFQRKNFKEAEEFETYFFGIGGATIEHLSADPSVIGCVNQIDPDLIVTILGSNDITNETNNVTIKRRYHNFLQNLKRARPEIPIAKVQIEYRYYTKSRFDVPDSKVFNQRAKNINTYLKRKLFSDFQFMPEQS